MTTAGLRRTALILECCPRPRVAGGVRSDARAMRGCLLSGTLLCPTCCLPYGMLASWQWPLWAVSNVHQRPIGGCQTDQQSSAVIPTVPHVNLWHPWQRLDLGSWFHRVLEPVFSGSRGGLDLQLQGWASWCPGVLPGQPCSARHSQHPSLAPSDLGWRLLWAKPRLLGLCWVRSPP